MSNNLMNFRYNLHFGFNRGARAMEGLEKFEPSTGKTALKKMNEIKHETKMIRT